MTRAMKYQLAGLSCAAFAITSLVGSIITGIFLGVLMFDFGFLIVICLAARVVEGSSRAARWCVAAMALYCLGASAVILGVLIQPERVRVGNHPMSPDQLPWVFVMCGGAVIWSVSCVACLLRALRSSPPARSSPGAAVFASG